MGNTADADEKHVGIFLQNSIIPFFSTPYFRSIFMDGSNSFVVKRELKEREDTVQQREPRRYGAGWAHRDAGRPQRRAHISCKITLWAAFDTFSSPIQPKNHQQWWFPGLCVCASAWWKVSEITCKGFRFCTHIGVILAVMYLVYSITYRNIFLYLRK